MASSASGAADRESLKNEVSVLKSQAGAGRLVAEQAAAGNLTENFVRAQSGQMLKGIEKARGELTPEKFEPDLSAPVLRAGDLALRLAGALRALRAGGVERQSAESAARSFKTLYDELSEMEDGLKQ